MRRHFLRKITLFSMAGTFFLASGVFYIKYQVLDVAKELGGVNKQIFEMQESLQVLKAEWGYLNKPQRLASLSGKFLKLEPTRVTQVASLSTFKRGAGESRPTMFASLHK